MNGNCLFGLVSASLLVSSCGSLTKPCEEEDFINVLLQTSVIQGGLKERRVSKAKFQDIIELKRETKTATCSGKLTGTRIRKQNEFDPNDTVEFEEPIEGELTWKVEETQDGKNFFTWVKGRQSAFDME